MSRLVDQRIAVTGGSGFLGRAVLRELTSRGCSEPFVPRSADYDLRDRAAIERFLGDAQPQMILHLAAVVGGIGANMRSPATFFYDNLMMGAQLIDAAWRADVEKFVCVGTICAYPEQTPTPFQETTLWDGYPEPTNAPYGIAKKALLVQLDAYRRQHGWNGIYLLPVNLYGPEDNFDLESSHVIPALIRKFIEARDSGADSVTCWGTGAPTREFLYVDDCARAIVDAAERYDDPEPVNIGSGQETSIRELSELICEMTGFKGDIVWDASRPDGQMRRALDVSRAKQSFGFEASTSLEEGLQRTIAWYEGQRS